MPPGSDGASDVQLSTQSSLTDAAFTDMTLRILVESDEVTREVKLMVRISRVLPTLLATGAGEGPMLTQGWRRFRVAVLGVLVAATWSLHSASPASAYAFECGRFAGSNPAISYRYYDMTSLYQTAFGEAQSAWDATSVPGYFSYQPSNGDPMVEVRDGAYSWTSWATTAWDGCIADTWLYNEVRISFNTNTMSGLSSYDKRLVAEHEAGHGYGLNHVTATCSSTGKAVMSQGETKFGCSGLPPYADDINGVIARFRN